MVALSIERSESCPTVLIATARHARAPGSVRFSNANRPTNRRKVSFTVTDLCQTFFRTHQIDFHNFWIWSQDVWTIQRIRISTWLDEFWLLRIVFELSCSRVSSQNDTFEFLRTFFAFRPVWVSIPLQQIYYELSGDEIASKKVGRCHLIDFDGLERPKHVLGPKSATSARMPTIESVRGNLSNSSICDGKHF